LTVSAVGALEHRRTRKTAVALSETFQPPLVLSALLVTMPPLAQDAGLTGALWGLLGACAVCLIPFAVVMILARRGVLSDHHVSDKKQRAPIMAATLALTALYMMALLTWQGPMILMALAVAFASGMVGLILISPWWKISGHAMTAGSMGAIASFSWGPWALVAIPMCIAVCISRVVLRAHTLAQVAAGAAFGAIVIGGIYAMMYRPLVG
jgi:membrane-associated phospholipid phosphatase